jgi:hypothetical protein
MSIKYVSLIVFCSAVLLGGIATTVSGRVVAPHADTAVNLFQERLAAYLQLRRQIIADLVEVGIDPNADQGRGFQQTLAAAMRKARRQARPGDILCQEVAGRMRPIVWNSMANRPLLEQQYILSEVPKVASVRVNDSYPDDEPLGTMAPGLLLQLDPLPPELQYRFLSDALILLDIDTSLIVDFLPHAFPRSS